MSVIVKRRASMLSQRGDTLVEVLVAIVIVSVVIAGAYVVSNNSLHATRATQERNNALKLAQAQLEQLKSLADTDPLAIFGPTVPKNFCLYSGSGTTQVEDTGVPAQDANCITDTNGNPAPSGTQPAFTLQISRIGNNFQLTETWIDVSGQFTDSLQLFYRDY